MMALLQGFNYGAHRTFHKIGLGEVIILSCRKCFHDPGHFCVRQYGSCRIPRNWDFSRCLIGQLLSIMGNG
jgi:hypothetical protein